LYYCKQCGRGKLPTIPKICNDKFRKGDDEFGGHHLGSYIALGYKEPNDPPIAFDSAQYVRKRI